MHYFTVNCGNVLNFNYRKKPTKIWDTLHENTTECSKRKRSKCEYERITDAHSLRIQKWHSFRFIHENFGQRKFQNVTVIFIDFVIIVQSANLVVLFMNAIVTIFVHLFCSVSIRLIRMFLFFVVVFISNQ